MEVDLVESVKDAGVVGAGGAGFPTHVKLSAEVDTYIANGSECEPLLHVDQHLMTSFPEKVVIGLQLGMEATGAKRGIIGIKRKYSAAINALQKVIKKDNRLEIAPLEDFYPAGDEFVLIYEILEKQVPEGGLPLDIGVVVNNIGTLINIADAYEGKPVTSRYVTVAGAVNNPLTRDFPIGTSINKALQAAGGASVSQFKVIMGGPIMGELISNLETPITKTTSGIFVLPESHYLVRLKGERTSTKVVVTKAACIRCQLCTEVCPRFLLGHTLYPDKIMRAIAWGAKEDPAYLTSAFLCVFCGACTFYGCPMGLDPCEINREVRDHLVTEGLKNPHKRKDFEIHKEREYRKLPMKRVVSRLDLTDYEHQAPITFDSINVEQVKIPLKQHIGAPSIPVVKVGQRISKGDLIGKIPEGSLGATIHASISGIVSQIKDEIVIDTEKK
ncbi:MAG: RnfABCDGE type electron transport complex subunit C [Candidatus Heimdallarchaeota archaeon]|nr:MAG: RnfABCDGE type electron transport complex subunit C [Candidatus Heimdallarchaeota archaeon]